MDEALRTRGDRPAGGAGTTGQRYAVSRPRALLALVYLGTASGVGLAVVSVAYALARHGTPHPGAVYWTGMGLLWAPLLWVAASRSFSANERLGITLLFAALSYGVKLFYHPLSFAFPDELQHLRSALDLVSSGHLFTPNALLPVSPYYPGLELVTTALVSMTGLSVTVAGFVVAGLARLTLVGVLFWLYARVTRSPRTAMIATMVYASNPHFLFFDAIFGYQTLALPFAALAVLLVHRWVNTPRRAWTPRLLLLAFVATTVTHHVTSYVLLLLLLTWLFFSQLLRRPRPQLLAAVVMLVAVIGMWEAVAAGPTAHYLVRPFENTALGLESHANGATVTPVSKPPWELWVSLASLAVLALAIPVGARRLWLEQRADPLAAALAVLSLGYFASLAMRFLPDGAELAGRAWDYLYLAIAPVVAVALEPLATRLARARGSPTAIVLGLLMVGSVTLGYPPAWGRLPGPYLASAFERSIGPLDVAAAKWQEAALGPGHRVAADYMNAILSGGYGDQAPVLGAWTAFLSPRIGPAQWEVLRQLDVDYLVVDLRLCHYLPMRGYYFFHKETGAGHYTQPLDCALLTKFDHDSRFTRVFDNGTIRIYRVGSGS